MAHEHAAAEGEHKHKILPVRTYLMVWASLIVLTYITVRVSYYNFGEGNLIIAMLVATMKASLVVLFFMALKYDEPFNAVIFVGSLMFLSIFVILTLADTMERGKVDPLETREIQLVPARPELDKLGQEGGVEAGTLHDVPGVVDPEAAPAAGEASPAGAAAADTTKDAAPAGAEEAPPGGH